MGGGGGAGGAMGGAMGGGGSGGFHPNSRGHTKAWEPITPTQGVVVRVVVPVLVDDWVPLAPIDSLGWYL